MNTTATSLDNVKKPDSATVKRIKNLAVVGNALNQISNSDAAQTISFSALSSLKDFKDGIEQLELDPLSQEGMYNLIAYLEKKLKKRIEQSKI